jgi:hypothetical protein
MILSIRAGSADGLTDGAGFIRGRAGDSLFLGLPGGAG